MLQIGKRMSRKNPPTINETKLVKYMKIPT